MAYRGAISLGRRANTSLLSVPRHIRTVSASNPFHRSKQLPRSQSVNVLYPSPGVKYSIRALNGAAMDPVAPKQETRGPPSENWQIKMLYDGDCPLCMREVNILSKRNQNGAIKFVDITSDDYSPEDNQGLEYETVMGQIHAILSDGTVVNGVVAFRRLYEAIGLGWVYAITKYEPIASMTDALYGFWAKYRLQVTGRPAIEELLEARRKKKEICEDSKVCKM